MNKPFCNGARLNAAAVAGTRSRARFTECPCSGKNLPKLVQPYILAILRNGPAHGYAITERIAELHTLPAEAPKHSGVYRVLQRMESSGLLTSRLKETNTGPARRVYSLTRDGRACLKRWNVALSQYKQSVETYLAFGHGRD
jgi:DNA-binding PadR family transcriptional regulator